MKKIFYLSICCLFLASCATSKSVMGPDGQEIHSINCSGSASSWGHCLEKAGEICGAKGYIILGQNDDQSFMMNANQFGAAMMPQISREMMVQCK